MVIASSFKFKTFFFLLINLSLRVSFGQNQGEPCTVERTRSNGVCKSIRECPEVIQDIRNNRQHTRCGFRGKDEIVCCPLLRKQTTTTTAAPITLNSRISEIKCDEYKEAVFEYKYSLSLVAGAERKKIRIDKCGHKSIPLIVGGEDAGPREFPHMALIGYPLGQNSARWACGGALISDQYVLTAGHCIHTKYGEPRYVRLGELNIISTEDDSQPEDFIIAEIIKHPNYQTPSKYNDIALLKLDRKVQLTPYKRPACLSNEFEGSESNVIATGWGHTSFAGKHATHLQKVILEKFTQAECNETYRSQIDRKLQNGIISTQMCVGSKTASKDTCQGDSGGPLQVYHKSIYCMYTIVGVTSFGAACGNIGVPGVYTRIYPYLDWIEREVWRNA